MATDRELKLKVIGEAQKALRELDRVDSKLGKLQRGVSKLARPVGFLGGAVAGATFQFARLGDEVQKMAIRTGFSTESLSELRFAAEQSGTSLGSLENGVKRMQRVINDANDGLSTSVRSFDAIGVSLDSLSGKSPEEQFQIIADALGDVEDASDRAALAQEIFGRAGTELIPIFDQGAEGMARLRQEARDLGIVMDQETANKAARMNDAINSGKQVLNGIAIEIGSTVAPLVSVLAEGFAALPGPLQKVAAGIGTVAVGMKLGLIPAINLTSISLKTALVGTGIGALLIAIPLLIQHWDDVKRVLIEGAEKIRDLVVGAFVKVRDFIVGAFQDVKDFLRAHWPEIATLIAGPFAIPVALATNAFGIRDKLVTAFNFVKEKVSGAVDAIVGFFTGLPRRVGHVGKLIANAIIDALNAGIQIINDVIPDKISIPVLPDIDLPDNPIPTIPRLQGGTAFFPGGPAFLAENGPEAVFLPRGSRVLNARQTEAEGLGGRGNLTVFGGVTVQVEGLSMAEVTEQVMRQLAATS